MRKFLIIQTAFIGDVILATPLIERLAESYPDARIDFVLRKGNERLLEAHPLLHTVWVWDKRSHKYRNLFALARSLRQVGYDCVLNLQRYYSSGWLTLFSAASQKRGFSKNPFSLFFTKRFPHTIEPSVHEVDRNLSLLAGLTPTQRTRPKLYPSSKDLERVSQYKERPYVCIAPTSVWFTKQFPLEKWSDLIRHIPQSHTIYLLGAPTDRSICEHLITQTQQPNIHNLAGQLSLLQSAALMRDAKMNYVNDSAPMHLASAMNAPTTAIYCATVPKFGFGPLSQDAHVVETTQSLSCRPCHLHGLADCPQKHFNCAWSIDVASIWVPNGQHYTK